LTKTVSPPVDAFHGLSLCLSLPRDIATI